MENDSMREAYGKALLELGRVNQNVVSFDADVANSTQSIFFAREFPQRNINVGIAEFHMCAMAAGFATTGKIPFVNGFANFLSLRAGDAIHNLIAQDNLNVKIAASYSGYSGGLEGASHQSINDIANIRTMPNMTVIMPCDNAQVRQTVFAAAVHEGPVYFQVLRSKVPAVYGSDCEFEIGKANILCEGDDVTIIAAGSMLYRSLQAAAELKKEGIFATVLDMHTIKPLDKRAVIEYAKKTGGIVTAEEHNIYGGLGSAVSEVLAQNYPTPVEMVAIKDFFNVSGKYEDLLQLADLSVENIINKAKLVIKRKLR